MNGQLFALLIIFGAMYWIYAMARIKVNTSNDAYNEEDTATIQELHRGLERMSARIESLETILLDRNETYRQTPPPPPRHETASRY